MGIIADLRHALRSLQHNRSYALTCILVLMLGIGANAAIFSIVYSIVLAPLPYPDVDRLVFVWEKFPGMPEPLASRMNVAPRNYRTWKREAKSFSEVGSFWEARLPESGVERPGHVSIAPASAELLPLLGARTRMGRLFTAEEEKTAARVAVLSDTHFESRFQRDPAAIGKSLSLGGNSYTVIGVLPPEFHLPAVGEGTSQKKPAVWVPLSTVPVTGGEMSRQMFVLAKLRPGVSLAEARTEIQRIAADSAATDPELNNGWQTAVYPLAVEDVAPKLHHALYVLLAAVGFLLLIACANLANLTLARASVRTREVAVRLAIGATRWQIVRYLLMESFVISLVGAGAGLLFAYWTLKGMLALEPAEFQRPEFIAINTPVFLFTAAATILTTLLFGLAPALKASRTDLNTAMKSGSGWGASSGRSYGRQILVAAEVALALLLVSGAGLMIRSFQKLMETGIGFPTERLLTVDIDLPEDRYKTGESRSRFFRSLLDRAQGTPGLTAASLVDSLPLHRVSATNFYIAGRPKPDINALPISDFASGSPDYLPMIGMRLVAGRYFTDNDLQLNEGDKNGVAIVNQAFVKQFFPDEQPLGRRLLSSDEKRSNEIIGVVSDYRPLGIENGPRPQIFTPYLKLNSATLIIRTQGEPETMANALRDVIRFVDRDLAAGKVETMEGHLHGWISQRQFNTLLMTAFGGLALILAAIGVYGVLSNMVASRRREIGIRMAIGATQGRIARLVLGQAMTPVLIGLVAGVAGSIAVARFLQALLFGVSASDMVTRVLSVCAVLLLTPAAIYVPLRRALRVQCTEALREE